MKQQPLRQQQQQQQQPSQQKPDAEQQAFDDAQADAGDRSADMPTPARRHGDGGRAKDDPSVAPESGDKPDAAGRGR